MKFSESNIRVKMFRGLVIALVVFLCNTAASDQWVVPEKRLSAAAGLSDDSRMMIASVSSSRFEWVERPFGEDLRNELAALASQLILKNPMTMEMHEQAFGVKIETAAIAGVKVHKVSPNQGSASMRGRVFMHIHGGAFFTGAGAHAALEGSAIAATSGIEVISVDYTLSTQSPFPAALNELVAVYRELLKAFPAEAIAVGGTSAGGNLTLATVHKLKALDMPLPGALFVGTPNADLLFTGDTVTTNEKIDNILVAKDGMLEASSALYAGEYDLKNPFISPIYGDFSNFPPTYLVSGTRDLLLSATVRVHRKLREAGVIADLNVFEGLPHAVYVSVQGSREFDGAFGDLSQFLQSHL